MRKRMNVRWLAALMLLAAAARAQEEDDPAQRAFLEAHALQAAYDANYVLSNDLVKAQSVLEAAIQAYAAGARKFPNNHGFNFGLGVLHNVRGEYAAAAEAFRRESRIMAQIEDEALDRDRFIVASGLGEAYEGPFDYPNALRAYEDALKYSPDDAGTREAIERCRKLHYAFPELPRWIAEAGVPDGTRVDVVYDLSPRTYLQTVRIEYSLEMRDGRVHVGLTVPVTYAGAASNRAAVERRLDEITRLVAQCFFRSGVDLQLGFSFVDPDRLPQSRGVTLWDHYLPPDRRTGDARNWAILSASGLELTPEMAASTVAHEVGHLLGLGHPSYYPEKPFADIMTAGYPWAGVGGKRVFPDDVKLIVRPLLAPKEVRGVLKRADACIAAGRGRDAVSELAAARQRCPDDPVLQIAYANAAFDVGDFGAAVDGYTHVLKSAPHDDQTLLLRGVAHARLEQYDDAILDFTRIVAQPSGGVHAVAYFERAAVYEKMGARAKAAADRRRSDDAVTRPQPDLEARKLLGLPALPDGWPQ